MAASCQERRAGQALRTTSKSPLGSNPPNTNISDLGDMTVTAIHDSHQPTVDSNRSRLPLDKDLVVVIH